MAIDVTGIEVRIAQARQAEADANRLDKSLDRLGKSGTKAEGSFDRLRRESTKMGGGFEGLKRQIFSLKGALGTLGVGISFGAAVNEIAAFGREMSVVQAVSRASEGDMKRLTETARELGASTAFSASEAAQGMVALSQAGFSAEQSLAAIGDTLNLAAAGGIGLGEAADLATNTLSQFNLAANEAGRVADVFAEAAARSNTTVGQLGIAMRQVGPVAASVGVSFEDTTAAISALSDAGLKGEQAGTGLRAVIASLVDPSKEAAGVIERLGVNISDLSDPAKVFEELGRAGMTAQDAVKLFGREAAAAGLILAGTSDKVADLAEGFRGAQGAAADMAKIMEDNLQGDLKQLSSAMSELILQTGDRGLTGALRSAAQAFTGLIRTASGATTFSDFRKEFQLLTDTALALSIVMGARLVASLTATAQATFASIAAQRAHSLALVEDASRTVASTAAKLAFNNMLVAEAQASVAAATGLSRLSVVQNTLLPAQTRAAAAAAAHTAALQAQAVAASNASISAGLLRGSLALLGGPVGIAVIAAGAFALLATRQSDTRKATDAARKANEELNIILGKSESLTLAAAEAARQKANQDVLAAHAALAVAEAEQQKFIARVGGPAAASRMLGSGGISFSAQTREIENQRSELEKLSASFLETDEIVRRFERTADKAGETTGDLTGETGNLTGETDKLTDSLQSLREQLDPVERAEREFQERTDLLNRALKEGKINLDEFNRFLGLTFEEFNDIAGGAEKAAKGIDKATDAAKSFAAEADPVAQIWEDAASRINTTFTDTFRRILDDGISGFKDLGRRILDIFKGILAQMATLAIARPIIVPIISAMGGAMGVSQQAQAGVINQLGGGSFGGFSGFGGFGGFGGGPTTVGANPISPMAAGPGFPGGGASSLPFSGNLSFLNNSSFATNPLASGIGGFAGNFGANALFGADRGMGANIGGTIGAIGGSFLPLPPGIGTAIGAFIGNAIGGLFTSNDFKANLGSALDKHSPALRGTAADVIAEGAFGFIGFERSKDFKSRDYAAPLQAIAQLDNMLAQSLLPEEIDRIRTALDGWVSSTEKGTINLETLAKERLGVALEALGGNFARLAERLDDMSLEAAYQMVAALATLERSLDHMNEQLEGFGRSGVEAIQKTLDQWDAAVTRGMDNLQRALESGDFAQIATAAQQAHQTVLERYQAEIQLATELKNRVEEIARAAAQITIDIQSRIFALQPGEGQLVTHEARRASLHGALNETTDPGVRIALLQEDLNLLGQMLDIAVSREQALARARIEAIQKQAKLETELINGEIEDLNRIKRLVIDTNRERLEGLNEELRIAQLWTGVLDQARRMLDQMTFTRASPLPTQARLSIAEGEVDRLTKLFEQASPEEKPALANRLLEALNTQLGLAQEAFQRPSPEYLTAYNDIIAQVSELEGVAQTEFDRALQLQAEIKAIQEHQVRTLEMIDAHMGARRLEAERIQSQANSLIANIEAETQRRITHFQDLIVADLKWIQGLMVEAYGRLAATAEQQLAVLLQGQSFEAFIASKQAEVVSLLTQIRDGIQSAINPVEIGGFAAGTRFVEKDMIAEIHRGERILTEDENRKFGPPLDRFMHNPIEGGFARGTRFVEKDRVAEIHRGERVLTAQENHEFGPMLDRIMNGGAGSGFGEDRVVSRDAPTFTPPAVRPAAQPVSQAPTTITLAPTIAPQITVNGGDDPKKIAGEVSRITVATVQRALPTMLKDLMPMMRRDGRRA